METALRYYKACIKKDEAIGMGEVKSLFIQQFAKSYFNMGLIFDQRNDMVSAISNYEKAFTRMIALKEKPASNSVLPDPYS